MTSYNYKILKLRSILLLNRKVINKKFRLILLIIKLINISNILGKLQNIKLLKSLFSREAYSFVRRDIVHASEGGVEHASLTSLYYASRDLRAATPPSLAWTMSRRTKG